MMNLNSSLIARQQTVGLLHKRVPHFTWPSIYHLYPEKKRFISSRNSWKHFCITSIDLCDSQSPSKYTQPETDLDKHKWGNNQREGWKTLRQTSIILSPLLLEQLDHQRSQSMLGYDDPTKVAGRCTSPYRKKVIVQLVMTRKVI